MYDVMEGVRVIEVAEHTFVPAGGMLLADWGADVIKVERVQGQGDPGRHLKLPGTGGRVNPFFEAGNRGKRSIALDLTQEAGREALYTLIDSADVFTTNLRRSARRKLGIEPEQLMTRNPRLIYARGTGYGLNGAMADDGGFDFPSSWCRSGSAYAQTFPGGEPPSQPGSVGDLMGGATLAGAIAAALFRRERTGKGAIVDNALYLVGIYIMSQSMIAASIGHPRGLATPQIAAPNPLLNQYRTRDDRWLAVCLLNDGWWPDFATKIGLGELVHDLRFVDHAARAQNARALIDILNALFGSKSFEQWKAILRDIDGVWAPMQNSEEVLADPQALENGFVTPVRIDSDTSYMVGASPCQFDQRPIGALRGGPGYGEHSEAVLKEIGMGDRIPELRAAGTIV
ncbi:MAG: CoA transferase [Sphingomonadaceae bacterium]|nr:CoA transferase [Sphingomonadaceae bacterium]